MIHCLSGYSQRTQISKALNARSNAVKTAVERYNVAAAALTPPRPKLKVAEVLDYVFLGQFDLLRHSRHGILEKPWAKAGARDAAVMYFKLQRAREEVQRVNVEARRLVMFMADVETKVDDRVRSLRVAKDLPLALQVEKYGHYLKTVHKRHRACLRAILSSEEMDSIVSPALRPLENVPLPAAPTAPRSERSIDNQDTTGMGESNAANADSDEEAEGEEGDEDEEKRAYDALFAIDELSYDRN